MKPVRSFWPTQDHRGSQKPCKRGRSANSPKGRSGPQKALKIPRGSAPVGVFDGSFFSPGIHPLVSSPPPDRDLVAVRQRAGGEDDYQEYQGFFGSAAAGGSASTGDGGVGGRTTACSSGDRSSNMTRSSGMGICTP